MMTATIKDQILKDLLDQMQPYIDVDIEQLSRKHATTPFMLMLAIEHRSVSAELFHDAWKRGRCSIADDNIALDNQVVLCKAIARGEDIRKATVNVVS